MPLPPDVTVAALAERQGRFLLVEERIARRLVFNQPAGHVERGETLLQAVARETREETAWRFTSESFLGAYLWRHPGTGRASLRFAFIGSVADHDARQPLDHGILRTHWLTRAEILGHGPRLRSPLVLRCIDDYLAGQRQSLTQVGHLDLHAARDVPAVEVA
ncbi:MAG TPA: NUDIX hydrolase [Steroidobacteraceae bacterium]|nr:NUDIX hydrolase [Steroidobacteraceae bacterium]